MDFIAHVKEAFTKASADEAGSACDEYAFQCDGVIVEGDKMPSLTCLNKATYIAAHCSGVHCDSATLRFCSPV
jgi:hypothetical protein